MLQVAIYPEFHFSFVWMKNYKMIFNTELDDSYGLSAISMVADGAIRKHYVSLAADQVVKLASEKKGIVTGPILIPDFPMPRQDKVTGEKYSIYFPQETIDLAALDYMKKLKGSNVTIQHKLGVEDVYLSEIWIKEHETMDKSNALGIDVPVGSLMVSLKVDNQEVRSELVDTGLLKAFSIEGKFVPELQNETVNLNADIMTNETLLEKIKAFFTPAVEAVVELAVETVSYELTPEEEAVIAAHRAPVVEVPVVEAVAPEVVPVVEAPVVPELVEAAAVVPEVVPVVAAPTIAAIVEEIVVPEVVEMIHHTDTENVTKRKPQLKFDKKLTTSQRIQAQIAANLN